LFLTFVSASLCSEIVGATNFFGADDILFVKEFLESQQGPQVQKSNLNYFTSLILKFKFNCFKKYGEEGGTIFVKKKK
jgi:hypothetical protein